MASKRVKRAEENGTKQSVENASETEETIMNNLAKAADAYRNTLQTVNILY